MDTNIIRRDAEIRNFLEQKAEGDDIAAGVAHEALAEDDPAEFFTFLAQNGCGSGAIWSLIFYNDTHAFFDHHYDEIEEIREELEFEYWDPIRVQGDLKNFYVWLAFEEVAARLAQEMGLE